VLESSALLVQADTSTATAATAVAAATYDRGTDSTASETVAPSVAPTAAAESSVNETGSVLWSADTTPSGEPRCIFDTSSAAASEAFSASVFNAATAAATATDGTGSTQPAQRTSSSKTATGRSLGLASTVRAPVFSAVPATAAAATATRAAAIAAELMTAAAAADSNKHSSTSSNADIDEADDEQERAAYRADVQAAFARVNSGQLGSISLLQLPALLMALDMTYFEERHVRALAVLLHADDTVSLQRFSDWYVSWLMADGVSVTAAATNRDMTAVAETFSAQLKTAASGGWRCGSCYFTNTAKEDQCAMCNKPSPVAVPAAVARADAVSRSSTGGFTFGGAIAASVHHAAPTAAATDTATDGGTTAAAGGFSFTLTPAAATQCTDHGSDFAADDASRDADSQQNDDEERAAHCAIVAAAFATLSPSRPSVISGSQFPALLTALHVLSSEEWQTTTLAALLDVDSNVSLQRFSDWYIHWLFTDGESASYYDSIAAATTAAVVAAKCRRSFNAQFRPVAGSWRCDCCYVTNTAEKNECAACGARNPAAPAATAATAANSDSGSISSSGFTYSARTAASAAVGTSANRSALGSISALAAPEYYTASATVSGGFRFAHAAAAATQSTQNGATAADTATTTAAATAAATSGFSFTPTFTPRTAAVAAAAATTAAAAAAATAAVTTPAAQFTEGDVIFDVDCVIDDTISDTNSSQEDHQERVEERAIIAAAFAKLNPSQPDVISDSQYPALFEALGTTYSKAAYARTLATLSGTDGNLSLQQFSDWYLQWLFDDHDSSSSSSDSDSEYHDAIAEAVAESRRDLSEQIQPGSGSWRCGCCYITNAAETAQCAACEAPKH
jgi:trimeric autotransporter adhesin